VISQAIFSEFFRISKRDGYDTNSSIKFGDNSNIVQLFWMEAEGRIPTQKKRIVQFDDDDINITYNNAWEDQMGEP